MSRKSENPWLTSKLLIVTGREASPCRPAILESTENAMFWRESNPTAVLASAFADPERRNICFDPTVVEVTNRSNVEWAPPNTERGTFSKARCMIRASTSVVVWPLGMANWAKSDPSKPSVMVCSSAETSNGKANGKVKVAAVDLLLVTGANGDWVENINESSSRSIDLIMFCRPWLGNKVPIRRTLIPSFNQVTWTNKC